MLYFCNRNAEKCDVMSVHTCSAVTIILTVLTIIQQNKILMTPPPDLATCLKYKSV